MKNYFLISIGIFIMVACHAQKKGTIVIYGYRQAVLPGMVPKDVISEDGTNISAQYKIKSNFFIYTASNASITPVEVWIGGQGYQVKSHQVEKTPVEYKSPGSPMGQNRTLVPKTGKKILQLTLSTPLNQGGSAKAKSLSGSNELVIVYQQKGRSYFSVLKNLVEVEPIALQ